MIGPVVTRGFSIGSIALVTLRGYFSGGGPTPGGSGGNWLILMRRRFRR